MLSASTIKGCSPGLMTSGPFWNFVSPSAYKCDLYLRARSPHHTATSLNERMALPPGDVATFEVRDQGHAAGWREGCGGGGGIGGDRDGVLIVRRVLSRDDFAVGNHWTLVTVDFRVENALNALDLRLEWHGNAALDVAYIVVR